MDFKMRAPINEAVFLLSVLDPSSLEEFRRKYPLLEAELEIGREGGVASEEMDANLDRAVVVASALDAGKVRAEEELVKVRERIRSAKRLRLGAQILAMVGSSAVLLSLKSAYPILPVVGAWLALLASLANVISDNQEALLKAGDGNLYEAYEKASLCVYKAGVAAENLRLLVRHKDPNNEIHEAIGKSNLLCEELAQWYIKISSGR